MGERESKSWQDFQEVFLQKEIEKWGGSWRGCKVKWAIIVLIWEVLENMYIDEIWSSREENSWDAGGRREDGRRKTLRRQGMRRIACAEEMSSGRGTDQWSAATGEQSEGEYWSTFMNYISINACKICINFARSHTMISISTAFGINQGSTSFPCLLLRGQVSNPPQVIFRTKFTRDITSG